jgi:hypothetical protein
MRVALHSSFIDLHITPLTFPYLTMAERASLLGLPRELRDQIYIATIMGHEFCIKPSSTGEHALHTSSPLLATNKQLRQELLEVLPSVAFNHKDIAIRAVVVNLDFSAFNTYLRTLRLAYAAKLEGKEKLRVDLIMTSLEALAANTKAQYWVESWSVLCAAYKIRPGHTVVEYGTRWATLQTHDWPFRWWRRDPLQAERGTIAEEVKNILQMWRYRHYGSAWKREVEGMERTRTEAVQRPLWNAMKMAARGT